MVCHHAPFCATLTDILLTINIKRKQTTTKETKKHWDLMYYKRLA